MNFIEELKWRGMIHDIKPGTDEMLSKEKTTAYVGIDPTADSLHIGHLVSIMMLKHFQKSGHKPILLLGGATGMIGDPSGRSEERNLLNEEVLRKNQAALRLQFAKFLDFNDISENAAVLVNNYDWMSKFSFLDFIRDVGKHITVNYMMAKDSVKKRMSEESKAGLSFTEFTYQLVQGYDFLYLYQNHNCKLQMGGSDQWGNITTGIELIRRISGGEAFALTCPLITKSDGSKFGKTEKGNVWLSSELTSPYEFCQFWINTSDEDAEKYIKIFTDLTQDDVETLILQHKESPHLRILQNRLAKEITTMVHSESEYLTAMEAANILFGKGTRQSISKLDEKTFLNIFEGVPTAEVEAQTIHQGVNIIELLASHTNIFPSKSEVRRMIKENSLTINQEKITNAEHIITSEDLINNKYILGRKGKKNYFLIKIIN